MEDDHPGCQSDRKRKSECAEDVTKIIGTKPAKAAKRTEPDSATTPGSGGTFEHLLTGIQASIQQAIAAGKERLALIDDKYYAGIETGVHSTLLDLIRGLDTSTNELQALTKNITSKSEKAPIYKLPNEIFFLIFPHLDTEALCISTGVCRRWRIILGTRAAKRMVWINASHAIHGTIAQLDAKWQRNMKHAAMSKALSIKLYESPSDQGESRNDLVKRLTATKLVKGFPSNILNTFEFEGELGKVDLVLWDLVVECRELKVLHWKSYGYCYDEFLSSNIARYDIAPDSPLAKCRLEEIEFDVDFGVKINAAFLQMLSQVKRVHLIDGCDRNHLLAILTAAEDSIEDLTVSKLGSIRGSLGREPVEINEGFEMQSLTNIHIQDKDVGTLKITAPNALSVRFDHRRVIDWTLKKSCEMNLQKLHIITKGGKTEGRLGQELFHMPRLEELYLEFGPKSGKNRYGENSERTPSFEAFSIVAFWTAVKSQDTAILESSLPKLKVLEIVHDPLLNEQNFLKYVEVRELLGQPSLQKVELLLSNHLSENTSGLEALRKTTMPGLSYQRFQDWRNEDTREWLLLTDFF